ncbi:MAG: hypothetical protein ACYC35_00975 [Pirellulales bacterium]
MIASLEALVLLLVLLAAVLLYRRLIHSQWFARLVGEVTHPSPESDGEVLKDLDYAEQVAWERGELAKRTAVQSNEVAKTIRRRVRRKPEENV